MLALALGIGATTTMFGLLNAVALRPLPYPESDRLVELWGNVERQTVERRGTSIPDYLDWKAKSQSFDLMSAWSDDGFIRYGGGAPERIAAKLVAGDYFARARRRADRSAARLTSADDAARCAAGRGDRRTTCGSAPSDATPTRSASSIRLNNQVFTIVGVAPAAFRGRSDASEVWVSMIAIRAAERREPRAAPADFRRWRGWRPA